MSIPAPQPLMPAGRGDLCRRRRRAPALRAALFVGGAYGIAALNFNSTGTSTFATNSSSLMMYVGGKGASGDTGAGAINQSNGTVNFGNTSYLTFGLTGWGIYSAYALSGGTSNIIPGPGIRLGFGGIGPSFVGWHPELRALVCYWHPCGKLSGRSHFHRWCGNDQFVLPFPGPGLCWSHCSA